MLSLEGLVICVSVNDILGYFFTTISFLSVVYAAFGEHTGPYACLAVVLALLSFCFLIYYIRIATNKTYTLQILSRENRALSIRLLLTYERLLRSQDEFVEKFCVSKLHVNCALYCYEIKESSTDNKDLHCTFTFHIKRIPKNQHSLDILIAQPRGGMLKTIKYAFDVESYHTVDVKPISLTPTAASFSGFWKANIPLNRSQNIKKITVQYVLKGVYRTAPDMYGAFLLCPFIYAKKMDRFDVQIKYPNHADYRPITVCLKLYPYNGKKYRPEMLTGSETGGKSFWEISNPNCITNAIYVIETHNPPPERES